MMYNGQEMTVLEVLKLAHGDIGELLKDPSIHKLLLAITESKGRDFAESVSKYDNMIDATYSFGTYSPRDTRSLTASALGSKF